ncbi:MAG: YcaQ family DNA glycosylase [Thermoclostridium sp.]|nr:YcaQ family DNA glycosylase [Thermoclostridium sp.]
MKLYALTNEQARNFFLLKHGLTGEYKFIGKQGVCDFIRQAGCIQFDPIDVCGKNAELTLQSRVRDFTKQMLYQLLYEDRKLVDYFDKNLAIFHVEDWKYFSRIREYYGKSGRSQEKIDSTAESVKDIIRQKGFVCSRDIQLNETVDWFWNPTTLSRAVLETLYFRGELIVHHKEGTLKHYALSENHISAEVLEAEDPNKTEEEFTKWRIHRRIGSVGALWNKPSDAWLGIGALKAETRNKCFQELLQEKKIIELNVEGINTPFYCLAEDEPLVEKVLAERNFKERIELIAPLDNFMWDRNIIRQLFGFDYTWEIYTPQSKRKYGYYVLPVLMGNRFIGRIEAVAGKKERTLTIRNFWKEKGFKGGKRFEKKMDQRLMKFAQFNSCEKVVYEK